jgi:hypothetical protein
MQITYIQEKCSGADGGWVTSCSLLHSRVTRVFWLITEQANIPLVLSKGAGSVDRVSGWEWVSACVRA